MPQDETYFDLLGIPENATYDQIEEGYKKVRRKSADDPARLRLIEQAYKVLSSPYSRDQYIQRLRSRSAQSGGKAPAPEQPAASSRRHGTSIIGDQGETPRAPQQPAPGKKQPSGGPTPEPLPARKSSGGGRSKTQILGSEAPASGRTPEPTPQPAAGKKPPSGGRSKTQILGSEPPPPVHTPEPVPQPAAQPPAGKKPPSGGRSKTQVLGSGENVPAQPPEAPAEPTIGKRRKTGMLEGEGTSKPGPKEGELGSAAVERKPTIPLPAPEHDREQTEPIGGEPVIEPVAPPKVVIRWEMEVSYQDRTQYFPLNKDQCLIGRPPKEGPLPDVPLPDEERFISRTHATIIQKGGQFFIQDNGSANGTYLNGVRLEQAKPTLLKADDVITIEGRKLRLHAVRG